MGVKINLSGKFTGPVRKTAPYPDAAGDRREKGRTRARMGDSGDGKAVRLFCRAPRPKPRFLQRTRAPQGSPAAHRDRRGRATS